MIQTGGNRAAGPSVVGSSPYALRTQHPRRTVTRRVTRSRQPAALFAVQAPGHDDGPDAWRDAIFSTLALVAACVAWGGVIYLIGG